MKSMVQTELKEQLFEVLENIISEEKPLFIVEADVKPLAVLISLAAIISKH